MTTQCGVLGSVSKSLLAQLDSLLELGDEQQFPVFHRFELSVGNVDVKRWLQGQDKSVRWYWSPRNSKAEVGGVGAAILLDDKLPQSDVFSQISAVLSGVSESQKDQVRFYGGMSFSGDASSDADWASFGGHYFVLPQIELIHDDSGCRLAVQFWCESRQSWGRCLAKARLSLESIVPVVSVCTPSAFRSYDPTPDYEKWCENIGAIKACIENEEFEKLVLSRRTDFVFEDTVSPYYLLSRLQEADPSAFHFCLSTGDGVAFIGGTPERLFSIQNRELFTEALAGTRARGKTLEEDSALAHALITSEKDIVEHQYVADYLMDCLSRLCSDYSAAEERRILKLPMIQHLLMRFSGTLHADLGVLDVLGALHPTPAVGGFPRQSALDALPEFESFERGWFAGPVGWVSKDACEFVVAIRSGLVRGQSVSLYSGAGIVSGSDAAEEWAEVENKIGLFLRLFGPNEGG